MFFAKELFVSNGQVLIEFEALLDLALWHLMLLIFWQVLAFCICRGLGCRSPRVARFETQDAFAYLFLCLEGLVASLAKMASTHVNYRLSFYIFRNAALALIVALRVVEAAWASLHFTPLLFDIVAVIAHLVNCFKTIPTRGRAHHDTALAHKLDVVRLVWALVFELEHVFQGHVLEHAFFMVSFVTSFNRAFYLTVLISNRMWT